MSYRGLTGGLGFLKIFTDQISSQPVRLLFRVKYLIVKTMNIKPLSDHLLIEPLPFEEKTKAGIFLPESIEKEKSEQGKIVAVGPGKKLVSGNIIPLSVKVGDKVLFTKYGPNEIKIEGREYLIAREEDILAILE